MQQLKQDRAFKWSILRQSKLVRTKGKVDEKKVDFLTGKQIYPYNLNTSVRRMHSIREFPPKSDFKNGLSNETISDEMYARGKDAFETFKCVSLYDYCAVYCHGVSFEMFEKQTIA